VTAACVDRQIFIFSELTKIHERLVIRPNKGTESALEERGEFVVIVGPKAAEKSSAELEDLQNQAVALFDSLTSRPQMDDEALAIVSQATGLPEQVVRKIIKKHKISVKRQSEPVA
jgi:16S rRNA C1402 (ribose-2'-O) methylase RsmI